MTFVEQINRADSSTFKEDRRGFMSRFCISKLVSVSITNDNGVAIINFAKEEKETDDRFRIRQINYLFMQIQGKTE